MIDRHKKLRLLTKLVIATSSIIIILSGCSTKTSNEKQNTRIALIDTGLSTKAIAEKYIAEGYNYLQENKDTEDTYGHGTEVASVILNKNKNVKFIPLVSTEYDSGSLDQVNNVTLGTMIRDAIDKYDCDIINISSGVIEDNNKLSDAVEYAEKKGVLIISSVGNDYEENPGQLYFPSAYETVIGVGALNIEKSDVADYSQRNDSVMLTAQGTDVEVLTLSGKTVTDSGTSLAAAYVTAVAANKLYKDNKISPKQLRQLLCDDAKDINEEGKDIATGFGAVE